MKCRLLVLGVFVLLGAVVNVAVAWGAMFALSENSPVWRAENSPVWSCTRAWHAGENRVGSVLDASFNWWVPVDFQDACESEGKIEVDDDSGSSRGTFAGARVYFTAGRTWVLPVSMADIASAGPAWYEREQSLLGTSGSTTVVRWASGWPLRCCEGFDLFTPDINANATHSSRHLIQRGESGPLPTRPLWIGIMVNTLFYAFVLWLVACAPVALRRWRRVRRGLCPACGYPVGASPVCTECGGPVTPRVSPSLSGRGSGGG